MAGRYGEIDYPKLTKRGFLVGLTLFAIGFLGEIVIHSFGVSVPGWEEALLIDIEALGVVIVLFAPLIFGVLLPLTE